MTSALLDSLTAGFEGDGARRAALDAVLRDGLPGPRSEAWKYTSLRALERRSFAPASASSVDAALVAHVAAPRLVFVNGQFDVALSDMSGLCAGVALNAASEVLTGDTFDPKFASVGGADDVFARLNGALSRDGAEIRIEAGVHVESPIHLVMIGAPLQSDAVWHARHLVELGADASATVVEHHLAGGEHAHLGNDMVRVRLANGARLTHVRVQQASAKATLIARTDAVLGRDARYQRIDLELGGALARHELNVRLEGQGSAIEANGVLFADGRRQLDTRLGIEHVARDTRCNLLWRGLASERARAAFHGGITIHAGADGSDAVLSNKNLLLSENAEIDTQPVLEIHADEVTAAHGATVGQLDPTALFYLRSRGLPAPDARQLLTAAFCREVVAPVTDAGLRKTLEDVLDDALRRLDSA